MEQPSKDLRAVVIAERVAGKSYVQLSKELGLCGFTLRRYCRVAVERGLVTAEQVRYRPNPKISRALPDDAYNEKWIKRIKAAVAIDAHGCWIWQGFTRKLRPYGMTGYRGKTVDVHRRLFELLNGIKLTKWQYVCHTCDVHQCCNPDHLFLGDPKTNMEDKVRKGRHHEQAVTHCPRGHEYNDQNTYRHKGGNARNCKLCARIRQRVAKGWPEELAASLPRVPHGYRMEDLCQR